MRIIALEASAVGNWIVKLPEEEDLLPPKSIHKQLYHYLYRYRLKHLLAVIVAVVKVISAKSVNAVVPLEVGATLVRATTSSSI